MTSTGIDFVLQTVNLLDITKAVGEIDYVKTHVDCCLDKCWTTILIRTNGIHHDIPVSQHGTDGIRVMDV